MTDNIPTASLRPAPVPADVTAALIQAQAACARWQPIPIKDRVAADFLNAGDLASNACSAIENPSTYGMVAFGTGMFAGIGGVLMLIFLMQAARSGWRFAMRHYRAATS